MKQCDIENLSDSSKSIRIIERMLKENKLETKTVKELTENQVLEFMNVCSYAMSFNRRYASNILMAAMIVIPDRRELIAYARELKGKFKQSKKFSPSQKKYFIQRIINGNKKLNLNKAVASEIINYYDTTDDKKETIEKSYTNSGIVFKNFIQKIYQTNADVVKIVNWLQKKTTNKKVIEHFKTVEEYKRKEIQEINELVRNIEKKHKIRGVSHKTDYPAGLSDNEKVIAVIARFRNINNPLFEIFENENIPEEKKILIALCFAVGDFYNKNNCANSFLINISSRTEERQKGQIARELLKRYATSKRYEDLHRYYFQDCLIGGWGDFKRDIIFARLVKNELYKNASFYNTDVMFKEKGLNLRKLAADLGNDDSWKKKFTRVVTNIEDSELKKRLNKIYKDSRFLIELIEQDLYCIRKNTSRLYLAGKKGAKKIS